MMICGLLTWWTSAYVEVNKNHHFILTVIDNFSKYAWAIPTKTTSGKDVTAAMRTVLEQGRQPRRLHVDRGKEFYNSSFEILMDEYGIHMYLTFSNESCVAERFNRSLGTLLLK